MLEHLPGWLGRALEGVRAGPEQITVADRSLGTFTAMTLVSPAFADGGRLPDRFTADGTGVSPPLRWDAPPAGTARLALLVEDADSPTPRPLVHAVVWGLAAEAGALAEGAIAPDGDGAPGAEVGRNSYLREGWLPPDPPTGHGEHRYVFQLFALGPDSGDPGADPGRGALVDAMAGHVLAAGVMTATYSRGDPAAAGPLGGAVPA